MPDDRLSERVRRKADRNAPVCDVMDGWIRDGWRRRTLLRARGRTLEIGAGTGKNPPLDGPAATREVAGVDFSPKRLAHARDRKAPLPVILQAADARRLAFPDGSFDTVLATCVFCRVPGPALGTGRSSAR